MMKIRKFLPKKKGCPQYSAEQPRNRACELVPKSQVKIGQKLKLKVKIGTLKNFGSNFFYKFTLKKDLGVIKEKISCNIY